MDLKRIEGLLRAAKTQGVSLDTETLSYSWRKAFENQAERLFKDPDDVEVLERLESAAGLVPKLPFRADIWKVQNLYYRIMVDKLPEYRSQSEQGDEEAADWVKHFVSLGNMLSVRVQ